MLARVGILTAPITNRKLRSTPRIVRALDGDVYEVEFRGQSHFRRMLHCVECEKLCDESYFLHAQEWRGPALAKTCSFCVSEERECLKQASFNKRKLARSQEVSAVERRSLKMSLASPAWRERDKIRAIYEEARRLSLETGIKHHVDHHYPLQGNFCSGLHVHQNLKILTAFENCSKSNGHPLEDSPALVSFIEHYGETGLKRWLQWAASSLKAA